ncbi:MAG: mechanosensitive ion channel family protein [Methylocystis sp.]|uniref:mechanosensitive ion channel family protein n=1 Tax=Methylocystis sp. TaxID=1911079 RepID=UPI003D0EE38F
MDFQLDAGWERLQNIWQGFIAFLPNLAFGLFVYFVFFLIALGVGRGIARVATRSGQPRHIVKIFSRLGRGAVNLIGAIIALSVVLPSLDAASVFGALGVGSVAVGFAAKDIFQNLLAGILLLVTRPFHIGDQIVSGAHEGTVEDIQIRATLLRTYDSRRVVIPNSELYTNRVVVNTAYNARRIHLMITIGVSDDVAKASAIILEEIAKIERVLHEPWPAVLFQSLGDFGVNLEVRYWIQPTIMREVVESTDEVYRAIAPALTAAGVDMPFPTYQILFHDQTEETDGERGRQREGWPAPKERPAPRKQAAAMPAHASGLPRSG